MTKKLAVINSENIKIIESIIKYFKNKDVEITYITDNENSEIIKNKPIAGIRYQYIIKDDFQNFIKSKQFELISIINGQYTPEPKDLEICSFINLHPSLLPAFDEENAAYKAFISGVKVSGITIHKIENGNYYGKIIAQYPVLIGLTTHFDEFKNELDNIGSKLYPPVIDAILNDRVFDFSDLFKSSCQNSDGCSGNCGNCH